jgi:hypothetical protein
MRRLALFASALAPCLLALALGSAAGAAAPDWTAVAGERDVTVITSNLDGSKRETTAWLVVVDGRGYIRTSASTRWGGNAVRNPDIALRIAGTEYPLRASLVTETDLRARIQEAFRAKYGWMDGVLGIFRGSEPRIMRLDPSR